MGKKAQYDTEIIGAFPAIAEYLKKLGVASIVEEIVPWEGNVVFSLVYTGFWSPAALAFASLARSAASIPSFASFFLTSPL